MRFEEQIVEGKRVEVERAAAQVLEAGIAPCGGRGKGDDCGIHSVRSAPL
jgi:hypothetical protein